MSDTMTAAEREERIRQIRQIITELNHDELEKLAAFLDQLEAEIAERSNNNVNAD